MELVVTSNTLITVDKHSIAYRHYKNGYRNVIVIAHGFYNSKDSVLLEQLAQQLSTDYDVFVFDFRGHGRSSGFFTWTSKEEKDLASVLDYLKGRYDRIGIIAFSLGASISINFLSGNRKADSLVCVCASSDLRKIDYKFWQLDWEGDVVYSLFTRRGRKGKGVRPGPFWLKKGCPIENIGRLSIPVLYIHGEKDWVIKPWHSQALFEKTNSKKKLTIIKNGPHAEYILRDCPEEFLREVRGWFGSTLKREDE